MGKWLTQWLVNNKCIDTDHADGFDAFEFIENCPAKGEIFEKLCIGGLCHSLSDVEMDILSELGHEYARRHLIIPIGKNGDDLYIATYDPCAIDVIDDMSARFDLNIVRNQTKRDLLLSFFKEQRIATEQVIGKKEQPYIVSEKQHVAVEHVEAAGKQKCDIPLDRLFEYFAKLAVNMRTSDIHFECNSSGMRVRFRVDGKLKTIQQLDQNLARAAITNIKLRAKLKLDETRLPQDGRLKVSFSTSEYDVRVSIIPNIYGENAVLRIFNTDSKEFSLDNIGLSNSQVSCVKELATLDSGLLLVAGPTGSGKKTTIYSLLKHISSPTKKVITIEDPIEYILPSVSQVSVDERIGLTFNHIIRAVLRQAPNVIFIGEIRDSETAQSAIQAALTGHLILSTVHAGSSEEAITRLHDLGISEYLIDSCVRCVISQELMRLKCKFCQGERQCDKCFGRKYHGTTGIFEILVNGDIPMGQFPSKFHNFGFFCTMKDDMARLREILYEEDLTLKSLSI